MNYRILGRTGIKVSEIGFGAWAIGGDMWGGAIDSVSLDALRRAIDLGVNFVDTAAAYGRGRSERLISKIYRERQGKFAVATKIPPKNNCWPAKHGVRVNEVYPKDWIR